MQYTTPKRVLFLCSGGGGNLKVLHKWLSRVENPRDLSLMVITDRECGALEYALKENIPSTIVRYKGREDSPLIKEAHSFAPDITVTNIHRILSKEFLHAVPGVKVNLHYSLLPAFSGTIGVTPVREAHEYGCKVMGVTLHTVTEEVDAGKPITQVAWTSNGARPGNPSMELQFRVGATILADRILEGESREAYSQTVLGRSCLFSQLSSDGRALLASHDLWKSVAT